jgi:hypothetical protein
MGGSRRSNLEAGGLRFVGCPQLLSDTLLYIRNLRTRHAVVTRDPFNANEGPGRTALARIHIRWRALVLAVPNLGWLLSSLPPIYEALIYLHKMP